MPALITPFDAEGMIDEAAHRHNLELLANRGITGFLLSGTTGEGPYLETGERRLIVSLTREVLGPDAYLMCGIAGESLRQALNQVEESAAGGADAALVMTPTSLARGNHEAVKRFFAGVADVTPISLFMYSVPAVTGYELPVDSVAELAKHERFVGMKDSGGRPLRIKDLVRSTPEDFMLYAGASSTMAQAMAAGAGGAITASANYVPELVSTIVMTSRTSVAEADELQPQLTELSREVEAFGVPGTKAAAAAAGLIPGRPRLPLTPVGPDDAAHLAALVTAARERLAMPVAT